MAGSQADGQGYAGLYRAANLGLPIVAAIAAAHGGRAEPRFWTGAYLIFRE
ncbi:hypothetical protein ONA91_31580 [Micromonospora sp. DR5-3]|uniref:hypothetical protein n=1 Tax=unclassified Micromonospora TaxID=2617518 RepID=UPI001651C47E|nr:MULTISPECIES: hypothetical protein [unclassified Micromonospora]MCW3818988.1 hypothetical protein [Micromonospora sp. DR5-3]